VLLGGSRRVIWKNKKEFSLGGRKIDIFLSGNADDFVICILQAVKNGVQCLMGIRQEPFGNQALAWIISVEPLQ
jgi:hypothetical protein